MSSDAGFFSVHRSIWQHDLFAEETQPFSKREAWIWLLSEAAWAPTRRRIKGHAYDLERGQLVSSYRAIAKTWRWAEAKVRRFFDVMIDDGMVDARSDHRATRITICNYEEYQLGRRTADAPIEAPADAPVTHPAEKPAIEQRLTPPQEEEERKKQESPPPDAREGKTWEDAGEIEKVLVAMCWGNEMAAPDQWNGGQRRIFETWFAKGWVNRSLTLATCQDMFRKKRDGPPKSVRYFEPGLEQAFADAKQSSIKFETNGHRHDRRPLSKEAQIRAIFDRENERLLAGSRDLGASSGTAPLPSVCQR